MKDKEKQIEEMAEIISNTEFVDLDGDTFCVCEFLDRVSTENIARELLKHYQPKLPEDSVVLSREEYEKIKFFQTIFSKGAGIEYVNMKEKIDKLEKELENKSKETAEKFVNLPKSKILTVIYDYEEIKVVELKELQELAKQCGVEIKE